MLPGNRELWLLERAKCGLGTELILPTYQQIHVKNILNIMSKLYVFQCVDFVHANTYFYLCMDSKLDFFSFTECIRNVNEKRGIIV